MEAQDYKELVKALRGKFIAYDVTGNHNSAQLYKDAAAAIEALQAQLPKRGQYVHGRELSREHIGDCLVSIDYEDWRCSVCGIVFEQWSIPKYNYCPNCGAKMNDSNASNALGNAQDGPIITPCLGCSDYDGYGGCKSKGGCARARMEVRE